MVVIVFQNTVTWPLEGTSGQVISSYISSVGHQRLWNFVNGNVLDVSYIFGPRKWIYTTSSTGTFYLKFKYGHHSVTLSIDGKTGWNHGIINKHGTFEYFHKGMHYLLANENWAMMSCLGDYSEKGLCPGAGGHLATPMGLPAVISACIDLSDYQGEEPVPERVREACAVLIAYGCEGPKLNNVLD